MNHIMRFPLMAKFACIESEPTIVPISYIEIDLTKLVDDHTYFRKTIENFEPQDQLNYYILMKISDWLLECYKKILHPIMSNRILDNLMFCLYYANYKRDYGRGF